MRTLVIDNSKKPLMPCKPARAREVLKKKKADTYFGIVSIRSTGNFNIKTASQTIEAILARYCSLIQQKNDYEFNFKKESALPHRPEHLGIQAVL